MKLSSTLFKSLAALGAAFAAGALVARRRAGRPLTSGGDMRPPDDLALIPDAEIIEEVVVVGISEVDPQGLTTFGEALDPEATAAAHTSVRDQRERLRRNPR